MVYHQTKVKDRAPFQIAFIYYSSSTRFDSESPKCKSILVSHNDSLICRVKHQLRFRALGFGQYFSNNFTTCWSPGKSALNKGIDDKKNCLGNRIFVICTVQHSLIEEKTSSHTIN